MSSKLHCSSATVWVFCALSPKKARTQLGREKTRVPSPYPMPSTVMAGMAQKRRAKWQTSAAPVGVHSSPSTSAE